MKVANSYASLLRGVSQQIAHERADGQHAEQVNFISDPINGLVRRNGTVPIISATPLGVNYDDCIADIENFDKHELSLGGIDYLALVRKVSVVGSGSAQHPILLFNKSTSTWVTLVRDNTDTLYDSLQAGGVSAVTTVGKYIYLCGNIVPIGGIDIPLWNTAANLGKAVVWIRGGAYARTYTIKVRLQNGTLKTVSYTTPSASYQGTLDTSDIPATATDYQKQVNDRVNAYNSAVTEWIGTASAAIQPENIANNLSSLLSVIGLEGFTVPNLRVGASIGFSNSGVVKSLTVDDGGDGSLIRGVADEVESADRMSSMHFNGKVVKVRGKNSEEAYYLKAVAKDALATGLTEVTWVEGAGHVSGITSGFFMARINDTGTTLHIASTVAKLNALNGLSNPSLVESKVGDLDTNPQPEFMNKVVTYLGVFQNRLLVGCGGTLTLSATADYLNFFRSTVLAIPASDAFSMTPQGSEDESLKYSVMYDQSLVLFGTKRQYVISGQQVLSPTAASMPVMSTYEDVVDTPPLAAGGLIFYSKSTGSSTAIFQIQPGDNFNSPSSFPASSQLSNYITGRVTGMTHVPGSPAMLVITTNQYRNGLFTFSYLDTQDGRKMDAWSRWEFSLSLGTLVAATSIDGGLALPFILQRSDASATLEVDKYPFDKSTSSMLLDRHRRFYGSSIPDNTTDLALTVGNFSGYAGALWADRAPFLITYNASYSDYVYFGTVFNSSVRLTSPFMRDSKGKPITTGRLTVGQVTASFTDTCAIQFEVAELDGKAEVGQYVRKTVIGKPPTITGYDLSGLPIIGSKPPLRLMDGQAVVNVMRESRNYSLRLYSHTWLPLNITAVEWSGQFFNRVQRF